MKKRYYLYFHARRDNLEIFYIGIGTTKNKYYGRAYNFEQRTPIWKNIARKAGGVIVDIMFESESYEQIKSTEITLIRAFGKRTDGLGGLVNLTDGGEGMLGLNFTKEHRENLKKNNAFKKQVINKTTGKVFDSIMDAAKSVSMKDNTLRIQLQRNTKKCLFIYK